MEKKQRTKKRGKVSSVRFDADFFEKLQKEQAIRTYQEAVDFFQKWYEQTFHPIAGNPVLERNISFVEPTAKVYDRPRIKDTIQDEFGKVPANHEKENKSTTSKYMDDLRKKKLGL